MASYWIPMNVKFSCLLEDNNKKILDVNHFHKLYIILIFPSSYSYVKKSESCIPMKIFKMNYNFILFIYLFDIVVFKLK